MILEKDKFTETEKLKKKVRKREGERRKMVRDGRIMVRVEERRKERKAMYTEGGEREIYVKSEREGERKEKVNDRDV